MGKDETFSNVMRTVDLKKGRSRSEIAETSPTHKVTLTSLHYTASQLHV